MDLGDLIVMALLLACPLLMIFMHGGGHGAHHSHDGDHPHSAGDDLAEAASLGELRQRREELEAEIARLESEELESAKIESAAATTAVP